MSVRERRNIPQSTVIGRRAVLAGAAAIGCGALGVGIHELMEVKRTENLELFVESSNSDERAEQLAKRLRATFRNVSLTEFSAGDMDADAWKALASHDSSWLVFGASERGVAALTEFDCYDWVGDAGEIEDTLGFTFDKDETMRAFPVEGSLGNLLCNMDLLDSVGAGTASDVDSFVEVCAYLTESGIEPLALERVAVDSASVGLVLDASLAYWASDGVLQPKSTDEALTLLAASVLRCGRRADGTSSAETREDALSLFKEGKAAMVFVTSTELGSLGEFDFSCLSMSIPTLSPEGLSVFRPTKSIVCSSSLPGSAHTTVLEWLADDVSASVTGVAGSVASMTVEEGGLFVKELPSSVSLSTGSAIFFDGNEIKAAKRQRYCEKIVAIWGQEEISRITYEDEVEIEA